MRIVVDGMGGDFAPKSAVEGAIIFAKQYPSFEIILIGKKEIIEEELSHHNGIPSNLSIENSSQVVEMHDSPLESFYKKQDSSIRKGLQMVKDGKADGFYSAGNSGAVVAASIIILSPLEGIMRPAISILIPRKKGYCILLDAGANVDCRPVHLFKFAIMGNIFSRYSLKINSPRIGLLNIGEEETKGNKLTTKTYQLLKESNLNFIGNVEGRDIFTEKADVIVCDGFVGNIILKIIEGVTEMLSEELGDIISDDFYKRFNYEEYGGAPLLGVDGVCFIGHGRSNGKTIANGIKAVSEYINSNVNQHIKEELIKL